LFVAQKKNRSVHEFLLVKILHGTKKKQTNSAKTSQIHAYVVLEQVNELNITEIHVEAS
jgi:hypothetical protein